MYFFSLIIVILCLTKVSFCAPVQDEYEVELLDSFGRAGEENYQFKYELSDGQMREETINYDNLDKGIAIRGSYKIELEDGEMQTIYYISDSRGHRISIDVPFPEDDEVKRPPPTRKPQQKKFSLDEQKAFEENRIDNGAARKGKVQEQQAVTAAKPTKIETATQKQTVTEKQTPIEKQTTAAVPKFIRKLEPYNRPGAKLLTKKLIVTSTTEAAASPEEIVEETSAKTQSQSSKEQEESKELKSDAEEGNLEQNDQEGAAEAEDYE